MPRLVRFNDGLVVWLHIPDHNPPHVHATFGGDEGVFDISSGDIIEGTLGKAQVEEVRNWLDKYRSKVMDLWETKEYDKNDWN